MAFFNTNSASQPTWGKEFLRSVSTAFKNGLKRAQVAQMMSALNTMSDQNLEDIGLQRSDIAKHAEKLVFGSNTAN